MNKLQLFCVPYAGGSAMIYKNWSKYLGDTVEICPLELAGRGKRFNEPFSNHFLDAIEDLYSQFKLQWNGLPYALFGHSMGSLLSYELYSKLVEMNELPPVHVFFSGHRPPHLIGKTKKLHLMDQQALKEELIRLGGTPTEIIDNAELFQIFSPILMADYKLIHSYEISPPKKIECDVTVLYGREDEPTFSEISEWGSFVRNPISFVEYEGGHFFINQQTEAIAECIIQTLSRE